MVMRGAIKIAVAEARIDDPSAMASFLAPIPHHFRKRQAALSVNL
jgi:hypothetical protein